MKKTYMEELTRAARWRLPPDEAQEVLEDYEAILEENPRDEETLRREVGEPVQAVYALTQQGSCWRWPAGFAGLLACLLLPQICTFPGMYGLWMFFTHGGWREQLELFFLLAGLAGAFWLWRKGARETGKLKGLPLILVLQFISIASLWGLIWLFLSMSATEMRMDAALCRALVTGVRLWVLLAAVLGAAGLVKYRLTDRCWLAVYLLGLTAAVLCMSVLGLVWSLNLEEIGTPGWWRPLFRQYMILTVLGLVGTGVVLCGKKRS